MQASHIPSLPDNRNGPGEEKVPEIRTYNIVVSGYRQRFPFIANVSGLEKACRTAWCGVNTDLQGGTGSCTLFIKGGQCM